jgi:GLPGLI family protein
VKFNFVLSVFLYFPLQLFSQEKNSNVFVYSYLVTVKDPSTGKIVNDSLIVQERNGKSVCYSEWNRQLSEKIANFITETESSINKNNIISVPASFSTQKTGMSQSIYKNYEDNIIVVKDEILKSKYYYEDSLNKFDWKLFSDTTFLGGYFCQKAETFFRGRHYIAWFTKAISLSNGPLKFGGLPGLIIKINDSDNQFNYQLTTFEKVSVASSPIDLRLNDAQKIDRKKHNSLRKVLFEDSMGMINAQGGSIKLNSPAPVSHRKFNPLELE